MKNLLVVIFLFLGTLSLAQGREGIRIVGSDTGLKNSAHIYMSEEHGIADLADFKYDLISYMNSRYGIRHVVMEMSKSSAFFYNLYLQTGDTTIFELPYIKRMRSRREFWRRLKLLNDGLMPDKKIVVYGVDFERMEFVKALRYMFDRHSEVKGTKLYSLMSGLPDSIYSCHMEDHGVSFRTKLYRKIGRLFKDEEAIFATMQGDDYRQIKDILENPASEIRFQARDKAMFSNMRRTPQLETEKYLCILGGRHTDLNSRRSALSRTIKHGKPKGFALIEMQCRECYANIRYGPNTYFPFSGSPEIRSNGALLAAAFGATYYSNDTFTLIDQLEFKKYSLGMNEIPTYYIFFQNQPRTDDL